MASSAAASLRGQQMQQQATISAHEPHTSYQAAPSVGPPSQQQPPKTVAWSPHADGHFAVASAELRLYRYSLQKQRTQKSGAGETINDATAKRPKRVPEIRLLSVQASSEVPWIRCLEWCPDPQDATLVALGLPNGRVRLMDMLPGNRAVLAKQPTHGFVGGSSAAEGDDPQPRQIHSSLMMGAAAKEFVPKNQRPCNALAWNPVHTNLIAAGLDKVRGDFGALVWDLNQSPLAPSANNNATAQRTTGRLARRLLDRASAAASPGSRSSLPPDRAQAAAQVARSSANNSSGIHLAAPTDTAETIVTPSFELGNNDCTVALSWVPSMPDCLVTGTGVKWMRLFDLRTDHNAPLHVVAHSKAVSGVTFNPFRELQLLTFCDDGLVKLWDARRITHSVASFRVADRGLQSVQWCPTRPDLLATMVRNENCIKFWDVRGITETAALTAESALQENGEAGISDEPSAVVSAGLQTVTIKPSRVFDTADMPVSIAWNKKNQYRMLCAGSGGGVEVLSLQEAIPVTWSADSGALNFAFGRYVQGLNPPSKIVSGPRRQTDVFWDVSSLMQERAARGYGMNPTDNLDILEQVAITEHGDQSRVFAPNTAELIDFWRWMRDYLAGKFSGAIGPDEKDSGSEPSDADLGQGIDGDAKKSESDGPSSTELPPFVGINAKLSGLATQPSRHVKTVGEKQLIFGIYSAPARNICLQLCGWGFEKRDIDATIARLEAEDDFERAAAIALFHLDIKRAISGLTRGSEERAKKRQTANDKDSVAFGSDPLRIVAMALSGFAPKATLWRETCLEPTVFGSIPHPYLRACFSFLCKDEATSFKSVLINDFEDISLGDKIGFACRFLDDTDLIEFVEAAGQDLIQKGRLEGLLLVGLGSRGVDLFQKYVDRTSDVQTAALVLSHVVPAQFTDIRADRWRRCYRDLLDRWRLWHARAKFDIAAGVASRGAPPAEAAKHAVPPQVYIRCNHCNSSIAAPMMASKRSATGGRGGALGSRGRGGSLGASRFSPSRFARGGSGAPDVGSMGGTRTGGGAQRRQLSACPSCRRPLPRCAVCLLTFAVSLPVAPNVAFGSAGSQSLRPRETNFDDWFTWCQTCRHGGHAHHIEDWFESHSHCPVTNCDCRCSAL